MITIDPALFIVSLFIVAIAAVVQGSIGLGFGQIAAAGLVWTAPDMLPATVILMALVVGCMGANRERSAIDIRVLLIALSGRIIGTLLAVPLLVLVSKNSKTFALLFGILILISVAISLTKMRPTFSSKSILGGGMASGFMGTITSIGAPPMGLVFQDQSAANARPTLNAFFAIGALVSLLALGYAGRFTLDNAFFAAYLAPGFIAGVYLSKQFHHVVADRFRQLILVFSSISAVALIIKSLT